MFDSSVAAHASCRHAERRIKMTRVIRPARDRTSTLRRPPSRVVPCFIRGSAEFGTLSKHSLEAAIMAQRKKRATLRKRKSTARSQGGKTRKLTRGKAAKRTVAKSKPAKRLAKARPKRPVAKNVARKRARPVNPPSASTVETVTVDVIEEAAPGEWPLVRLSEVGAKRGGGCFPNTSPT